MAFLARLVAVRLRFLDFLDVNLKDAVVPVAADSEVLLSLEDFRAAPVILAIESDHVVVLAQHPPVGSHVGFRPTWQRWRMDSHYQMMHHPVLKQKQ